MSAGSPGRSPALATLSLLALALALAACVGPNPRHLHYVDGELVESPAPGPRAYEAYLRARVELERAPPNLEAAREYIDVALYWDGGDPHLWTTRGEIEMLAEDPEAAERSFARALQLRPGYPEAERLLTELRLHVSSGD